MKHWWLVLATAVAALAAAWQLPAGQEEQMIIPWRRAASSVDLAAGVPARQQLILPAGTYAGVVLYSGADRLAGQPLRVKLLTAAGEELARGQYARATYVPLQEELLRLEIPTARFRLLEPEHVVVDIALSHGSLPLQADGPPGDLYSSGALSLGGAETSYDVALSLLAPQRLSFGARQGIVAGVILMLGLAGVHVLKGERAQWRAAVLLVAVLVPLALSGYWFSRGLLGIADWDYYFSLHHYWRHSLVGLHAFPFWNPYTCGGTAGLADPEFSVFTPTFLLELIFGVPAGLRLAIYLSVIVGAWGMLALSRRLGLSVAAAVLAALAVAFGSVNLLEVTEGHVNVFAAMWIPWIFWSWLGAYRSRASSLSRRGEPLLCGIFLALTFFQGGIYLLMYTGLAFMVLLCLVQRPRKALAVTVMAGLWAVGLAAVKLVPVLLWLRQFPDQAYQGSTFTLPYLGEILLGRHLHGAYVLPEQTSGWHEYGAYVGLIVLALALIGAAQVRRSRVTRGLVIGAALAAVLSALGPQLAPLFDRLWFFPRSNISRIILFSVIPLSLLAGVGLDRLQRLWPAAKRQLVSGQAAVIVLVGLAAIDIFSLSYPLSEQAFVLPPVQPPVAAAPYPIAYTPDRFDLAGEGSRTTRAYAAARAGYGTFAYCSVLGPAARVRTVYDEGGSALLDAPYDDITYEVLDWSPNAVHARTTLSAESEVTLNTNYAEGWTVNGQAAAEVGGLVAVRLTPGAHELFFEYEPPGWRVGLAISLLTIVLALVDRELVHRYGGNEKN